MEEFEKELTDLINKHSLENDSDTPDFILAKYLVNCLKLYNKVIQFRELWIGEEIRKHETKLGE